MFDSGSTTFTFDLRRQYTGSSESGEVILGDTKCDLITFLSTAQTLDIPFVALASQPALSAIGVGGTATIAQSQMSRDASLAYKKIKDEDKGDSDNVYNLLLSEVSVLGHPAIRYQPNLVELLGIGWEITSEDDVWPVLVFQKSHFGDLSSFAISDIGRHLQLNERAEICGNIVCAVADMHNCGIIHGDLKPSNVLIYRDEENRFSGKVADFGYSSCVSGDSQAIFVPESWPWNAPEHNFVQNVSGRYEKVQAEKMDMYSAGLICLWLLFEPYFAGIRPLPQEAQWAQSLFTTSGKIRPTLRILESVKKEKKAAQLASELLQAELLSRNAPYDEFDEFFWSQVLAGLLNDNYEERTMSLIHILQAAKDALKEERTSELRASVPRQLQDTRPFEVIQSLHDLYRADYEVRRNIVRCMERRYNDSSPRYHDATSDHLAIQLAFCYRVGFGIPKDEKMVQRYLHRPEAEVELDGLIQQITAVSSAKMQKPTWIGTTLGISVDHSTPHAQFRHSSKVKEMIKAVEQEIADFECTVPNSLLMAIHRESLALAYSFLGRWREAIELTKHSIRMREEILGCRTVGSLSPMTSLISYYRSDGQWKKSEEMGKETLSLCQETYSESDQPTLSIKAALASTMSVSGNQALAAKLVEEVLEIQKGVLGSNHPDTVGSMAQLARITLLSGDIKRAMEMELQVVKTRTEVLGQEHVDTLISKANLALVYKEQGYYEDAQNQLIEVVRIKESLLDRGHPSLLVDYGNLASVYWYLGKAKEAATLTEETIAAIHNSRGKDNPEMLTALSNLATTWWRLGKWQEARGLEEDVLKVRKELHPEHPDTLKSMANLAATYCSLGEWKQAEDMNNQVISKRRILLGPEHPDTIQALVNMGGILSNQARWTEAESIETQALEMRVNILGVDHPDTLNSMANLATTWRNQGKLDMAECLEIQVLGARQKMYGTDHIFTLQAMGNLASTYWRLGRLKEAGELEQHVLEARINAQGIKHLDTLTCMYNLACTYKSMGKHEDAEDLMLRVVEIRQECLPRDHPDVRLAVQTLGDFREEDVSST